MKTRTYKTTESLFCPHCHKRVLPPDFINTSNISGKINLTCSSCGKGKVIIDLSDRPKKLEKIKVSKRTPKKSQTKKPRKKKPLKFLEGDLKVHTKRGVIDLKDVKVGDRLLGANKKYNKVIEVDPAQEGGNFYNINSSIVLFENQSIITDDKKITHVKNLKVGDSIYNSRERKVKIKTLKKEKGQFYFYRLTLDGDHTYIINDFLIHNATRYWVGGSANYDATATANWAATSGGAGGASAPTLSDDVVFDSASHTTNYTVTLITNAVCRNATFSAPASGNVTLAGTAVYWEIYGSLTFYSGLIRSTNFQIRLRATSGSHTINLFGVSLFATVMNAAGGTYTLASDYTETNVFTLQAGTFDTGNFTTNWFGFTGSNAATRVFNAGSSSMTVGAGGWSWGTGVSATFNAGTSVLTVTGANATITTGTTNPQTFNEIVFTSTATSSTITGDLTCAKFTKTGGNVTADSMIFGGFLTVSGAFEVTGNAVDLRLLIRSSVFGTQRTITAGSLVTSNTDWQDINGQGAASWNLASITGGSGDCGRNSNFTFTTGITSYWVPSGGTSTGTFRAVTRWASSSGGTAGTGRSPLPQDTSVFDANSIDAGSRTITQDKPRVGTIVFTGVTNTPAFTTSTVTSVFGSLTLVSGMTLTSSTQAWTFEGNGTYTITMAGKSWNKAIDFECFGGKYTMQDALTTSSTISLSSGEFDANDFNISSITFASNATRTRTLTMGNGVWTMSGNNANLWNVVATGLTLNRELSTIRLTGALTADRTWSGGSQTYYNWENATTGAFAILITGSNTFNELKINASAAARTVKFTAGTTTTFVNMTRDFGGTNVITLDSTSTSTFNLVKTGGGVVSLDYMNIQHSVASPGTLTFYAGTHSTNNQGVASAGSGWIFTDPPPVTQTILGKARIVFTILQTILGKAAIQGTTTRTETGIARLQKSVTQTILGVSRVTSVTVQTETGVSRIQVTTTRTVAGIARIQISTAQTETGVARIAVVSVQTETGVAAIQGITIRTLSGRSRIQKLVDQTILGKATIQNTTAQTVTGVAFLRDATRETILGKAFINNQRTKNITGVARIIAPRVYPYTPKVSPYVKKSSPFTKKTSPYTPFPRA